MPWHRVIHFLCPGLSDHRYILSDPIRHATAPNVFFAPAIADDPQFQGNSFACGKPHFDEK